LAAAGMATDAGTTGLEIHEVIRFDASADTSRYT
jgi:hypothetical protein